MPKPLFLKVFANPFCAPADHEGRAHGHIQYEPRLYVGDDSGARAAADDFNSQLPFVGCRVIATPKAKGSLTVASSAKLHHVVRTGNASHADWDHRWEYDTEPTLVEQTPYYLHALRVHGHHGAALLPADKRTYGIVHGTFERWRTPHVRMHQFARERGVVPHLSIHSEHPNVLKARLGHAEKRKADATLPERDHLAEWEAFVGDEVLAERMAHEQANPQEARKVSDFEREMADLHAQELASQRALHHTH